MSVYGKIHTARFGKQEEEIAPLEFVRPLSELCLRAAALNFRNRPTFAGVPEKYKVSVTGSLERQRACFGPLARLRGTSTRRPWQGSGRCVSGVGIWILTTMLMGTGPLGSSRPHGSPPERVRAAHRQRGVLEAVCGRPLPDMRAR